MAYMIDGYVIDGYEYDTLFPGKIIVPDMYYWFQRYLLSSRQEVRHRVPKPPHLKDADAMQGLHTVVELLFNENWTYGSFVYKYKSATQQFWPKNIKTRANVYPGHVTYMIPTEDADGQNLFFISDVELELLAYMMVYKLYNGKYAETSNNDNYVRPGYIGVDIGLEPSALYTPESYTPEGYFITEDYVVDEYWIERYVRAINPNLYGYTDYMQDEYSEGYAEHSGWSLSSFDFDTLTEIGKLIYIYLDWKLNGSLEKYNTENKISSSDNLLGNMFEMFLLDAIFTDVIDKGTKEVV